MTRKTISSIIVSLLAAMMLTLGACGPTNAGIRHNYSNAYGDGTVYLNTADGYYYGAPVYYGHPKRHYAKHAYKDRKKAYKHYKKERKKAYKRYQKDRKHYYKDMKHH